MSFREDVVTYLRALQDDICRGLEAVDGKGRFEEDLWSHAHGGGGRTRVITHGSVFEKGGVNFSAVEGPIPSFMKQQTKAEATSFFATGVSLVLHPVNPFVPIVHMNVRYFETDAGDNWFGGGIDLTPVYVIDDQARHFHKTLKQACDRFDPTWYPRFRDWADDYFYITHRKETRGIGGIFYDYLREADYGPAAGRFAFMQAVGDSFLPSYIPIAEANKSLDFTAAQKEWQLIRRGRYVEFNLVYDRGTRFGLETGGRIESILMSLPEYASWKYNHHPAAGGEEERSLKLFTKGIRWA